MDNKMDNTDTNNITVIDSFTIPDFESNILIIYEKNIMGYAFLTIINKEIYLGDFYKNKITDDIVSIVYQAGKFIINGKFRIRNIKHFNYFPSLNRRFKTFVDNNIDLFEPCSYVLK